MQGLLTIVPEIRARRQVTVQGCWYRSGLVVELEEVTIGRNLEKEDLKGGKGTGTGSQEARKTKDRGRGEST